MGFSVSKTALSPFSVATGVIGLISFGFTVGTFLRVVWTNVETIREPAHEVHSYLTTMRIELLEERMNIKLMRKQAKRAYRRQSNGGGGGGGAGGGGEHRSSIIHMLLDDVALKTMDDSVRQLVKKFRDLERPFLAPGAEGIDDWKKHRGGGGMGRRRESSVSPYYEHSAYAPAPEKGFASRRERSRGGSRRGARGEDRDNRYRMSSRERRDEQEEEENEVFWAQRCEYRSYSFGLRLKWLRHKSEAQQLFNTLTRVQVRRIARQVGGISLYTQDAANGPMRAEQALSRIEDKLNNIVGVRRVD